MKTGWRGNLWAVCGALILTTVCGCERRSEFVPPPPPEVTVQQPHWRKIVDHVSFTGNTRATATVELRARVSGYLQRIEFADGASVHKGDVLFVIEPAPFQAILEARLADLERAKAALQLAQVELKRSELLQQRNIAAQQEVDQRRADLATARANVAVAQAAVTTAQLDVDYTKVRAPITGRIGRHLVDVGNLILAQQTVLATIISIDPIHAYFYISESDLLRFRQMIREHELPDPRDKPPLIRLGLANEQGFPHEGHVDFRDLGVDPDTGTILLRALFPNPQQVLLPGLFVRLQAPVGEPKPRLMIDERAVSADQRGHYVLVVNNENKVEYRPVELGLTAGGMREVTAGVSPDDWVIVNGLQRARPGATVKPQRAEPPADESLAQSQSSLQKRLHRGRTAPHPLRRNRQTPAAMTQHTADSGGRKWTGALSTGNFTRDASMFSRFFIERPIFANVIAIVTMLVGGLALWTLPVEQYPNITPPTIQVAATYPGANASVVADTVATPIEQQVNGVENMMYMTSSSSSDGSYSLTVTFEIGTDLEEAQVLVQNRVALVEAQLPEEVKRQGVTVRKQSTNIILVIALVSSDEQHDSLFLSNYATLQLRDALSRIEGVGDVTVFGTAQYSMRIWLDPEKLQARRLTTQDVVAAILEQNVQVAAGRIGQPPAPQEQNFQYTVTVPGRLSEVEQFARIIVKTGEAGQVTYLKDVARVELGAQSYDQFNLKAGRPNANIGIYQLPGANALDVARQVGQAMEELSRAFPPGMKYEIPLDTTQFIAASVREVYTTLIEAGALVLIVILVFLQNWRAVLIPATTVPVTILGAFIAMALLGFTVNLLTLFGLVLAIGIVVDDAIVIVENAARHIEEGMAPKSATIKAMDEVLGPIIGITLVLLSVFLPSAFLPGITGQLYRQFALTIAATALISAINALTLKPAQSAMYLRPPKAHKNILSRVFNAVYDFFQRLYVGAVRSLVAHVVPVLLLFVALVALTAWWYWRVPTGFLPTEDRGYILISVQLPDAASQQRTREVMQKIDTILAHTPGIKDWITIGGLSLLDRSSASNSGTLFVTFEDWAKRDALGQTQQAIVGTLTQRFSHIQEAIILPLIPPSISGLGFRGGFQLQVEDRAGVGLPALFQATQQIIEDARGQPSLAALYSTFRPGVPQLMVEVHREKVKKLGVPLSTVFHTLQASLGSAYVNDFNKFGRMYQVRVQAEAEARAQPRDIAQLDVRNAQGDMIPLGSVVDIKDTFGPHVINRYNLYPTASISGEAAPGYSSGQALDVMEHIAQNVLPDSMGYEWTGIAYEEKKVGGQAFVIFGMAVLLVYLVLAAQYESWLLPAAVIMVVPLGLLGALAAVSLRGIANDIYTQIGMVLIIALASKNAILIVEFARDLRAAGRDIREAAIEAARLRLRPIIMTSFAFILGVVPLVLAHGAGAAGQQALGTAVFGGMIVSTILSVFFVPVFFVVFQVLSEWRSDKQSITTLSGIGK